MFMQFRRAIFTDIVLASVSPAVDVRSSAIHHFCCVTLMFQFVMKLLICFGQITAK